MHTYTLYDSRVDNHIAGFSNLCELCEISAVGSLILIIQGNKFNMDTEKGSQILHLQLLLLDRKINTSQKSRLTYFSCNTI